MPLYCVPDVVRIVSVCTSFQELSIFLGKGPPSASLTVSESDISQTSATNASVVLHWEVEGDNVSNIVITSSQALPCGNSCVVGVEETELNQTVQFGVEYNITVRAVNCGGSESDTIKLLLNGGCDVPCNSKLMFTQFCMYNYL